MSLKPITFTPSMDVVPGYRLAPWPPKNFAYAHTVSTGNQTWDSVAKITGVDAKTLVEFNFQTTKPREINYYLRNYLGCWQSRDRKNFDFEGATHGTIYIPQKLPASDHLKFHREVAAMLERQERNMPTVTWGATGITLGRTKITQMIRKVRATDIVAVRSSAELDHYGEYAGFTPVTAEIASLADARKHASAKERAAIDDEIRDLRHQQILGYIGRLVFSDDFHTGVVRDQFRAVHEFAHVAIVIPNQAARLLHNEARLIVTEEIVVRVFSELWLLRAYGTRFTSLGLAADERPAAQKALARMIHDDMKTWDDPIILDEFDRTRDVSAYDYTDANRRAVTTANLVDDLRKALGPIYHSH